MSAAGRPREGGASAPADCRGASVPAGWRRGWWQAARRVPSPHHGPRPAGTTVSLVVLHSISLPPGVYGGDAIERFFTTGLDPAEHPYFATIAGLKVSSHFLLRRDGEAVQFVPGTRRAWHAGASSWRGRDGCNDYSIGVELEGLEGEPFDDRQYPALAALMAALRRRWPVTDVAGHEHVAPCRKADPGPGFDWPRLARDIAPLGPWRWPPGVADGGDVKPG